MREVAASGSMSRLMVGCRRRRDDDDAVSLVAGTLIHPCERGRQTTSIDTAFRYMMIDCQLVISLNESRCRGNNLPTCG